MGTQTLQTESLQNNKEYTLFSWAPQQATVAPIDAVKAEGVYVYDRSGKQYLDLGKSGGWKSMYLESLNVS